MKWFAFNRKVGAPAVVVLAAVVNVVTASEQPLVPVSSAPDLSWAICGGATHSVETTRALIAEKAATRICCIDRLAGVAPRQHFAETQFVEPSQPLACSNESPPPWQQPEFSTHQHSAP